MNKLHKNIKLSLKAWNSKKQAPDFNDDYNLAHSLGTISGYHFILKVHNDIYGSHLIVGKNKLTEDQLINYASENNIFSIYEEIIKR
jgi:hypothetical protein